MWNQFLGLAVVVLSAAYIIYHVLRTDPEHMRLDTERTNREHYARKEPRRF